MGRNISRFTALGVVAALVLTLAPTASADRYTVQENRAWTAILRDWQGKAMARASGKSVTVSMMRWVCDELDSGTSWESVGEEWQFASSQAQSRRELENFLRFGASVSVIAVMQMCPWHRRDAGL